MGRERKAREGKGSERKGEERKGRGGKERDGKGREEMGKEGKGREWNGRKGKVRKTVEPHRITRGTFNALYVIKEFYVILPMTDLNHSTLLNNRFGKTLEPHSTQFFLGGIFGRFLNRMTIFLI